jgi:hydrogenase maturation factor
MYESLPLGKLKPNLLKKLLDRYGIEDPKVKVGPGYGEDAAAIDLGDRTLLLTSDPITFTPERIGWYAVHVNGNDIASMGGTPQYFLATVLLPEDQATEEMADRIFSDITDACHEIGCVPVGGHTEITFGLDRPIVSGAMVGEVDSDQLITSAGAEPGDMLILSKGIAIEATAILAQEKAEEITQELGADFQEKAARFLEDPGLSVLQASRSVCKDGKVNALHDPTEGGIANALWELAEASDVGLIVIDSEIPRYWESVQLARIFGINLLGAISSGALLITTPEPDTSSVLENLSEAGIEGQVIGRVVDKKQGIKMLSGNERIELPRFDADELTKVL